MPNLANKIQQLWQQHPEFFRRIDKQYYEIKDDAASYLFSELHNKNSVEIANILSAASVTGRRQSVVSCPIRHYYEAYFTGLIHITSTIDKIFYVISTPDNIKTFMGDFDQGRYPELEAKPS
jgi:hypothetical protein